MRTRKLRFILVGRYGDFSTDDREGEIEQNEPKEEIIDRWRHIFDEDFILGLEILPLNPVKVEKLAPEQDEHRKTNEKWGIR